MGGGGRKQWLEQQEGKHSWSKKKKMLVMREGTGEMLKELSEAVTACLVERRK